MPKRAFVALVCSLSLAICLSECSRDGAIRVAIDYPGMVPACIEVTAAEAEEGGDSSTVRLGPDTLAGRRRAVVAVFRKPEWIRSIDVRIRSFESDCLGGAIEEIAAPESIAIDSDGTIRELQFELQAVDADGDRFAAKAGSVQGTDCDDARSDIHPGATEPCGNVDYDCDGLNGCASSACDSQPCSDGNICTISEKCEGGTCVGGTANPGVRCGDERLGICG